MRKIIDRTGEINYNTFGSKMIIKEYRNANDIDVYFPKYGWTKEHTKYSHFIIGDIKCVYEPRTYGVGYLGNGEYNFKDDKKAYKTWCGMLERCYSERLQEKYTSYKGCEVCKEWYDLQTFAQWHYKNYYEVAGQRMCLDKDILVKNNKVYSPETCIYVPERINKLFIRNISLRKNSMPIGVRKEGNSYIAECQLGDDVFKKYFHSLEEAFKHYKIVKENYIKEIANEYKNEIPSKLYDVMMTYEVNEND